jgi:peptidyl-prolyl isomerase E (cyclophilin E)
MATVNISKDNKTTLFIGMRSQKIYHTCMSNVFDLSFIGGIDQQVTEAILHAAFIPFGEIVAVQLSPDNSRGKYTQILSFE